MIKEFFSKINIFKQKKSLDQQVQDKIYQTTLDELRLMDRRNIILQESFQFGNTNEYIDPDEENWTNIASNGLISSSVDLLKSYRKISRNLCTYNPNAISIVRNFVKFVFGKGFVVQATVNELEVDSELTNNLEEMTTKIVERFQKNQVKNPLPAGAPKRKLGSSYFKTKSELNQGEVDPNADPELVDKLQKFSPEELKRKAENQALISLMNNHWNYFAKRNKLKKRWKETGNRFFRDGEAILRWFEVDDTLEFRFIDPANLKGDSDYPEGIKTKEGDIETVISYFVTKNADFDLEYETVPANEIQHIKNSDSDELRGWPILVPVMKRLKQYDTWIQDRISLNKIRASIALLRKHKAGRTEVSRFVDSVKDRSDPFTGSNGVSSEIRRQRIHGGSIVDAPKDTEYEFLAPDVQASDVRYDGRAILLSVSAGVGQPEYMVSADASNSNYSSTMVSESPGVREFEDWQDMFVGELESIWYRLRDFLIKKKLLPVEAKRLSVSIQPSQLIARNRLQDTQSNTLLYENRILSPQVWCAREGLNYEEIMQEWSQHINQYPEFIPDEYIPPKPKEQR